MVSLNNCVTINQFYEFLNKLEPIIGKRGGRRFISRDTKHSYTMNQIVYRFQKIVELNKYKLKEIKKSYRAIQKLEDSKLFGTLKDANDKSISNYIKNVTKIRQFLGNFIFYITHNKFDKKSVLHSFSVNKKSNVFSYNDFAKSIDDLNNKKTFKILSKTSDYEIKKFVNTYLVSLQKNAEERDLNDRRINLLISQLKIRYPHKDFDNYFRLVFSGIVLCPDGIRIILKYLKEKGKIQSHSDIRVCDSLEELTNEISKLNWEKDFKVGFLVRCRAQDNTTEIHITPAYIENRRGSPPDILITDTFGGQDRILSNKKTTFTELFIEHLKKGLPENLNSKIYASSFVRQGNWTACPIFSINDITQIFYNPKLFDQIKKQADSHDEHRYILNKLPPAMMKPHHGWKKLTEMANSEEGLEVIGLHKNQKPKTIREVVAKHKRQIISKEGISLKEINNYTNAKEIKYLSIVLDKLLQN